MLRMTSDPPADARQALRDMGVDFDETAPTHKSAEDKDPTRVLAGLKAAAHNPRVSEEAKHDAQQRIAQLEGQTAEASPASHSHDTRGHGAHPTPSTSGDTEHDHRVAGGYRATLARSDVVRRSASPSCAALMARAERRGQAARPREARGYGRVRLDVSHLD